MKVKGSLYWIYSFTSGCKGKMLVAILLAVIGVLCGMAPYFALAGILSGLIQNHFNGRTHLLLCGNCCVRRDS